MKKDITLNFIVFIFLIVPTLFTQSQVRSGISSIDSTEIFENLVFLSSDSLKGRTAGSPENNVAADFIAKKFIQYRLKPLGNDIKTFQRSIEQRLKNNQFESEDYFQKFYFLKTKLSSENYFRIHSYGSWGEKITSFEYRKDFIVQVSDLYNNLRIKAPVVFAGYGIDKGEKNYNDYMTKEGKPLDVKNKIVLIVDGFPQESNPESGFLKSRNPFYRNPLRKMEVAEKLGALAIIIVSSPLKNEPPFGIKYVSRINAYERNDFVLPFKSSTSIPIFFVSENVCSEIFKYSDSNLKDLLLEIEKNLKPNAFEFKNIELQLEINFEKELISTQNVVGWIEGSDDKLKDEYIIIGAHYDHVGLGYFGSMNKRDTGKVHNGADDNASGTSALIELAEAFSLERPKRSILFIAFSAEENGLLGSKYYAYYQPLKPLENCVAMFNFDMVGRNENELLWIGGIFYSDDLRKLIEEANQSTKFELLYNTGLLNFASDQAPFLRKEIPSAFFFSGLHDDYHTPNDDYDKVNYSKIERVAKLGYQVISKLANSNFKPKYQELPLEERKELVESSMSKLKKYRTHTTKSSEENQE